MNSSVVTQKQPKGFALIVTLSLMILLTVVAVGLLTLSTLSLRTSAQGEAMATARANARLALMMALGDLQKNLGPDTRISATASIMDSPDSTKEHLTGVWNSWKIDPQNLPTASDYEKSAKADKFLQWLVSNPDPDATESADFATSGAFPDRERVELVPVLKSATRTVPAVYGGLVALTSPANGQRAGSYAYAVLDEGVKARIDSGHTPATGGQLADLSSALGSGVRADAARIAGLEKLDWKASDLTEANRSLAKAVSFKSGGLLLTSLGGDGGTTYDNLYHDVTTSSVGLFADVVDGGLKQDLNSILNAPSLPSDLSGSTHSKLYTQTLGFPASTSTAVGQVEPFWDQLYKFSNYHRTAVQNKNGGPTIAMQPPSTSWASPYSPPPAVYTAPPPIMPTVVKTQMFYSLMAVPLWLNGNLVGQPNGTPPVAGNWTEGTWDMIGWHTTAWNRGARYFLMVCMMPCITLHNPYNINLEVSNLSVEMNNIPMAIQIKRRINGGAESGWLPNSGQAVDNIDTESKDRDKGIGRKYLFNLTDAGKTTFSLAPGEVCVFTPTAPADASYLGNPYRSWNNFTDPVAAQPMTLDKGFRGVNVGFYAPRISANELSGYETYPGGAGKRGSTEYFGPADQVKLRIRPALDLRIKSSATVEANKTRVSLVRTGSTLIYNTMKIDVGNSSKDGNLLTGLEKSLGFEPADGELDWIPASEIAGTNGSEKLNQMKSYTFGVVTISAKTTAGAQDNKGDEGALAAKPMAFHSPVGTYGVADVKSYGMEPYPYEASVIALNSGAGTGYENYLELDDRGRGFAMTGLTSSKGQKFATVYEMPLAPLQNFTQLNSANPAASNSLARFTYPIGNSWAHPMIPTGAIQKTGSVGTLDHSFLLNSLFYDHYFFSGIAQRGGQFSSSESSANLAEEFFRNPLDSPLRDRRLQPHLADGETREEAISALSTATATNRDDPQARYRAASHQLMQGAFNVNSTSVKAWKAMLASLHPEDLKMFRSDVSLTTAAISNLKNPDDDAVRFSRFLVPNNNAAADASDTQMVFQGPRDITASQLDALATEIVAEVRERGPFLSMAEFVNRRIGSNSELTRRGALQAAIDKTDINNSPMLRNTGYAITGTANYDTPEAMTDGRSDQGAPGYLTQADLLAALGNAPTVRSDTFTIRAYGEARSASGEVTARTWCEAVVQRMPEYVSGDDKAHTASADLASEVNRKFGRRFVVNSFRWVSPSELETAL